MCHARYVPMPKSISGTRDSKAVSQAASVKPSLSVFLLEAYDPVRLRPARPLKPVTIRIDDQTAEDVYSRFCTMTVTLSDPPSDEFRLTLTNVPWNEDMKVVVQELGGEWDATEMGRSLTICMDAKSVPAIRKLAKATRKVCGRGQRYADRNWKWVTRKTADSLERFAQHLLEWRRSSRRSIR